jgi:hypothetical protein
MGPGRSGRAEYFRRCMGCVGHGSAERLRRYVASVLTHLDDVVMVEPKVMSWDDGEAVISRPGNLEPLLVRTCPSRERRRERRPARADGLLQTRPVNSYAAGWMLDLTFSRRLAVPISTRATTPIRTRPPII